MTNMHSKKPTLALMGEFSAGKSTLTNLLLGCAPLPTRVTATRLPPVWLSHGTAPAERVDHDGVVHELPGGSLDCVNPDSTAMVRLQLESEMLELCDLIDLPGISDPNMPAELWRSVMQDVDHVIWCTHATQAWRQSEAAAWESVMDQTAGRNLLLITQMDKLTSQRDRDRVLSRLKSETEGLFEAQYGISLLDALDAGEDATKWEASGAGAFTGHLVDLLITPTPARHVRPAALEDAPAAEPVALHASPAGHGIAPKRVRNTPGERLRTRPITPESEIATLGMGGGRLS